MRFFPHLLARHLFQHPGRALSAILVLAVAAALMLALASAGAAVRFRLGDRLEQMFPEERLVLEPGRASFGPIAVEPAAIDDATIAKLEERPELLRVYPIEPVRFPVRAEGELFGNVISSDAIIHGVPRALVEDALATGTRWAAPDAAGKPWPIVVSTYFLDLYNLGMARAGGLPLISPEFVVGKHFRLYLGESYTGLGATSQPVKFIDLEIKGLTEQPGLLGLAMPIEVVAGLNRAYAPTKPRQYVQLVVDLEAGADRAGFLKFAAGLMLRPSRQQVLGEQLKTGVRAAGWGLIGLALAVFLLGLLTFYLLFAMIFHARRADLLRLRALGLAPASAAALALGEVLALAAAAMAIAVSADLLLSRWAERAAVPLIERISVLPPDLLALSLPWVFGASAFILAAALLPALPMLWSVARVEPGRAIRDH